MAAVDFKHRLLERLRKAPNRVGLLLLLLVCTAFAGGYKAHHYVVRESAYCLSCHSDTSKTVSQHAHKNLACQDCHRSEFWKGSRIAVGGWFGGSAKSVLHGQPDYARCRTCHLDPKSKKNIALTSGHLAHVVNKTKLLCNECHELKSHSTAIREGVCQKCHSQLIMHNRGEMNDRGMAKVTCLSCHDFKAPPTATGGIPATGCMKCHSGRPTGPSSVDPSLLSKLVISADATHGNVNACRLCHDPHAADAGDRRRGMDCERCHKGVMTQHQQSQIVGHPNCTTCHQIHGPRPKTPALCAQCHQRKVPVAGSNVLAGHHENCSSCHKPHIFRVTRVDCANCHKKEKETIAAWTDTRHTDCLTCHQGHSEAKTVSNCVNCHTAQQNHGHTDCLKCHEPHQSKAAVKACNSCHTEQAAALSNQKPAPHHVCASCHDQHNVGATLGRCGNCHQKERTLVVKAPVDMHKRCSSCHQPHQFQKSATVCLNCHRADQRGPHSGACLKCHQAHGPPASPELTCRSCHQAVPEIHGKHADCTSCHAPHKSAKGGPTCGACHTSQLAGASSWTPVAHRGCQSCHNKHAPVPPTPCSECHAPIAAKSLFKGHRCLGCHSPHQAPVPWFSRCVTCHAPEAAATRVLSGTHSNCKGCHEPHTDKLPSCQGCHQSRPGSHASKGHEKCLTCHESHAVKVQGRDKCLTCHKDKKDHFPQGSQCASCHLFK